MAMTATRAEHMLILLHIAAGLTAIAAGAVALMAPKGATLHRRSGTVFVCAMLFMSASGAGIAVFRAQPVNIVAGSFTFYLVTTAWLTVRRPAGARWLDLGALLLALAVGLGCAGLIGLGALGALSQSAGDMLGLYVVFGAGAWLAVLSDTRLLLAGGVQGKPRLVRHLWRMGLALFIAAGSFFLGQADLFPEPVRRSGLLALPVLAVLALTFYWLARVSFGRRLALPGL
jgi:uncharacterized membrane protein